MAIKIILVAFVLFVLSGIIRRHVKRELNLRELIGWSLLWILVIIAVLTPQTTDLLASKVGVGRGLDLVVVLSIITLFYILIKVLSKVEKLDKDISVIVREIALRDGRGNKK